ncbi:hypothetical protein TNCV_4295931 [Trichonephila clavipes]|nr:hypothetical protein TNCV_4295931 [Trichonephila clavipes]
MTQQTGRQIYMMPQSSRQTNLTQQQQLTRSPYQLYRSFTYQPTQWWGSVWWWCLYKPITASGRSLSFWSSGKLRSYGAESSEVYPQAHEFTARKKYNFNSFSEYLY